MLGHVFPTDSKIGLGPALGLDFLRKACSISSVPVFGLGGMSADLIGPVLDSGAAGVAGISLFQQRDEFYQLKRKPWIEGISRKGID
jgi:thiamine monophosphate synthase